MAKGINGYEHRTIPINRIKWSYVFAEGLGAGGTYEVFGEIRVREQSNGTWTAQIVAQANAQSAKGLGDVTFSAKAYMYVDGSLRSTKHLSGNGAKMNSAQIKCDLGSESFVLPQNGTVEIELEVRYTVVTGTGVAAGLNMLGEIGYKINKKLGEALGKIRERINQCIFVIQYSDMKKLIFLVLTCPLLLIGCKEKTEESADPRSIAYNDRAVAMMQDFVDRDDILPDSTALAQCHTHIDTIQLMMKNIVDSCQILMDSALMYSPDYYFYYTQKASFYACGAYYEKAFQWINKAIEKKDIPELRLGAGMFLQKMGKEKEAEVYYGQVIDKYESLDTLSRADLMNYTLALGLSGQKEKGLRVINNLAKDTLLKRQLLLAMENPEEVVDAMMP